MVDANFATLITIGYSRWTGCRSGIGLDLGRSPCSYISYGRRRRRWGQNGPGMIENNVVLLIDPTPLTVIARMGVSKIILNGVAEVIPCAFA